MKTITTPVAVCLLSCVLCLSAAAHPAFQWGDYNAFAEPLPDTGVSFFLPPDTPTNPSPFPPPSEIQQSATYPATGDITVGEVKDFLAAAGFPRETFGFNVSVQPQSSVIFDELNVIIDGTVVARGGSSEFSIYNGTDAPFTIALLPDLNLCSFPRADSVMVSYSTSFGYENLREISMAATPEPTTPVFLATGLAGMVLLRRRRRRA